MITCGRDRFFYFAVLKSATSMIASRWAKGFREQLAILGETLSIVATRQQGFLVTPGKQDKMFPNSEPTKEHP